MASKHRVMVSGLIAVFGLALVPTLNAAHAYHGHHTSHHHHHGHDDGYHPPLFIESSLRGTLLRLPSDAESEYFNDRGRSISERDGDMDSASRLAVTWNGRFGQYTTAFALGAGLTIGGGTLEVDGIESDINEFGIIVEPALSIRANYHFDVELAWQFGLGSASIERPTNEDDDGAYFDTALIVRPVYTFGRGAQIFADIGIMSRLLIFEVNGDDDIEQEVRTGGLVVGLGGGYRF